MRFLFCCEFYYPSVGGVAEVMRQIAERLVRCGHEVTVATTRLNGENVDQHNGVKIVHFAVTGNEAYGLFGEVDRYRDFVTHFPADAILVKAAQQWSFDALFPVLDDIPARKVFIPCGFSGLYEKAYQDYYARMPGVFAKFDRLIFYADKYRDIDFCRAHGLTNLSFIPNGANEAEFQNIEPPADFRRRLGIKEDSFVFSTVGNMTWVKGHREVAQAFLRMKSGGRPVTLVLNGNQVSISVARQACGDAAVTPLGRMNICFQQTQFFIQRARAYLRREGFVRTAQASMRMIKRLIQKPARVPSLIEELTRLARQAMAEDPNKQVLILDLPRDGVVDLFKASDLFVFASNVEYSPLVLFEAAAAGTPFLTVPVGNAEEIAAMTGGGQICPAEHDNFGYTCADPDVLAVEMARLMNDPALLERLGQAGHQNWEQKYSWDKIALQYEAVLCADPAPMPLAGETPPKVSVVMPVFNGGKFLMPAVQSILAQTFTDFELLLIDDGSTDGAIDEIRAIADPRIRIFVDPVRQGTAVRRNQGTDAARGIYIACMDADDIAFPERLERQAAFLDAHADIDLLGCRAVVFRGEDVIGMHPFAGGHAEICARPWRGFTLPQPTWMGRAEWFRRFRYAIPYVVRAEDQELLLRSHAESRFACLDDILLGYRQGFYHPGKTLAARRHLLAAQERYFLRHRQFGNAALALAAAAAKVAVDLLAALPGCDRLFFARMAAPAPEAAARKLKQSAQGGGASS